MNKFSYDIKLYPFAEEVKKIFENKDLSEVHKKWSKSVSYDLLDDVSTDQNTVYHKHFYDNIRDTEFYFIFNSFIDDVVRPIFKEKIIYQRIPTFRVHQPNNLAVAEYHRDKDYSHSEHEVNFFVPLTNSYDTTTIWVESSYGKGDYSPMNAKNGYIVMWDGANCRHGNKVNITDKSRVSIDFRVLPFSKYVDGGLVSTSNKTKMTLGEYWK